MRISDWSSDVCSSDLRLANAAATLGLVDRAEFWQERADTMRARIEDAAWREDAGHLSATFPGDTLDASLLQLLELHFLAPDAPRFRGTLPGVEEGLRRGGHIVSKASEDDFGPTPTPFSRLPLGLIQTPTH